MALIEANQDGDTGPGGVARQGSEPAAASEDLEMAGFHEFLPTANDVVAARHFVHETLAARGASEDMIAAAELVVDEFALNAVRHTGTFFAVSVEIGPGMVKVAVRDDSNIFPAFRQQARTSIVGLGLSIVASTADHWGAESLGRGKEVWAELR